MDDVGFVLFLFNIILLFAQEYLFGIENRKCGKQKLILSKIRRNIRKIDQKLWIEKLLLRYTISWREKATQTQLAGPLKAHVC